MIHFRLLALGFLAAAAARGQAIDVLVVGDSRDATRFVRAAFEANADPPGLRVEEIAPSALAPERLASADAVCLCDVPRLDPAIAAAVVDRVRRGGGLLVVPGDAVDREWYEAELFGAGAGPLPCPIGPPEAVDGVTWNLLDRPAVARRFLLEAVGVPHATALAEFSDGAAAIVSRPFGLGRGVLFATPCDAEASSIPLSIVFPILFDLVRPHLVRRLGEPLPPGVRALVEFLAVRAEEGLLHRFRDANVEGAWWRMDGEVDRPSLEIPRRALGRRDLDRLLGLADEEGPSARDADLLAHSYALELLSGGRPIARLDFHTEGEGPASIFLVDHGEALLEEGYVQLVLSEADRAGWLVALDDLWERARE